MMVFAYALYVPAGIALTSAYASHLLADSLHVTVGGGVLFVVILASVAGVAYLGIGTSSWVDLALVAGEVAVIAALAISILVKVGPVLVVCAETFGVIAVCTPATSVPRSVAIALIATFMFVAA